MNFKKINPDFYQENKEYYDRNAIKYESASWYYFNKYKNKMVFNELKKCLTAFNSKDQINILEIGPGTGYLLEKILNIRKFGINYTGIEHSAKMCKILITRFSNKCKNFNLINNSVIHETLKNLLKNNKYDLVIGSSILHHLLDYEKIIKILAQQTTLNGIMYFVREPIHINECKKSNLFIDLLEKIYSTINSFLMSDFIKNIFWPQKIKAENAQNIAYHMYKNGISIKIFNNLSTQDFKILFIRKYNRRVSSFMSYIENKWLKSFRKDIFGNTLFSICLQKIK